MDTRRLMNAAGPFIVHNCSRHTMLAANVRLADSPRSRRIGLLHHEMLDADEGLWIYPTQAIHTFGMRFPIDVVFLDPNLRVKRIYHGLAPFRLTTFVWGARSVLELASGSLAGTGTTVGDELQFSLRKES
jgi:uncharacterized membrane protein (UPF0127 family)